MEEDHPAPAERESRRKVFPLLAGCRWRLTSSRSRTSCPRSAQRCVRFSRPSRHPPTMAPALPMRPTSWWRSRPPVPEVHVALPPIAEDEGSSPLRAAASPARRALVADDHHSAGAANYQPPPSIADGLDDDPQPAQQPPPQPTPMPASDARRCHHHQRQCQGLRWYSLASSVHVVLAVSNASSWCRALPAARDGHRPRRATTSGCRPRAREDEHDAPAAMAGAMADAALAWDVEELAFMPPMPLPAEWHTCHAPAARPRRRVARVGPRPARDVRGALPRARRGGAAAARLAATGATAPPSERPSSTWHRRQHRRRRHRRPAAGMGRRSRRCWCRPSRARA